MLIWWPPCPLWVFLIFFLFFNIALKHHLGFCLFCGVLLSFVPEAVSPVPHPMPAAACPHSWGFPPCFASAVFWGHGEPFAQKDRGPSVIGACSSLDENNTELKKKKKDGSQIARVSKDGFD